MTNTTTTISINPNRNSKVAYQALSTQWNTRLQNHLNDMGLNVQVRTLGVPGPRALNNTANLNTLGVEIEGINARKEQARICMYIEQFFSIFPQARVRGPNTNLDPYKMTFNHPYTNQRMFPITEIVVKF